MPCGISAFGTWTCRARRSGSGAPCTIATWRASNAQSRTQWYARDGWAQWDATAATPDTSVPQVSVGQRQAASGSDCEALVAAEPGLEAVELGPEHGRHLVGADLVEPLLDLRDLGAPLVGVDRERLLELLAATGPALRRRATPASAPGRSASRPRRRVPSMRSTTHLSTRLFSPKPGHRKPPSSSRRNQLT